MKITKQFFQYMLQIIVLCILLLNMVSPQPVYANLDLNDYNNLYESLLILSTGWDQYHVDRANSILSKTVYSAGDWEIFFLDYFSDNPFTEDLRNYLVYPVFWWFSNEIQLKLQTGLVLPLKNNISTIVSNHHDNLGFILETSEDLRETIFSSLRFLNEMVRVGVINNTTRSDLLTYYFDHVSAFPHLWLSSVTINIYDQPYICAVRAQLFMNIGDTLPLDGNLKVEIANRLNLIGKYLEIWNDHSVIIVDNNGLNSGQLSAIDNYLDSLPKGIHNLRYITVNELLGNEGDKYKWFYNTSGINIFDLDIGYVAENGFPDDVPARYSDIFSLVLAHEVNHIVDVYISKINPSWADRKNSLIAAAGDNHMNYLHSTFEDGFFTNAPQEFFASIANQWFSDTAHTLELGLVRWMTGYPNPINQFLFFTEVYSQGKLNAPFYTIDEQGILKIKMIPVYRDSNGRINGILVNGTIYKFSLDEDGNVTSILNHSTFLPLIIK